ncbi:hypothetical protein HPP92_010944 [Vanilla planifolia]|uniref:Uncharacterized protein n=1 Tax=Vanilla planifolia TaxID=51239 RepID=A0A835V3Z4_VANPL|nr:hypothetical protein HPP92_010944 [Vanilla planifolia]
MEAVAEGSCPIRKTAAVNNQEATDFSILVFGQTTSSSSYPSGYALTAHMVPLSQHFEIDSSYDANENPKVSACQTKSNNFKQNPFKGLLVQLVA